MVRLKADTTYVMFEDLLACPACEGSLSTDLRCRGCGMQFDAPDDIPNLRLPADARTETVRRFYEQEPFPGYPPRDSLSGGAFDVVYSSGVVHHTSDPRASFAQLARLARPGGIIVLGVYNTFARMPSQLRRLVARVTRYRMIPFDPVLRERTAEQARRNAWLRDQYQHPEEHCHSVAEVQRWFADNGVEYLRTYPSAVFGDEQDLFERAADNWGPENWLAQVGWMRTLGHEGGLFFTVGRHQ